MPSLRLIEFLAFFVAAPIAVAVFLPASVIFPALFTFTAVGLVLLALTPGYDWRELWRGWGTLSWPLILLWTVATALTSYLVVISTAPGSLLFLPQNQPGLMLMIALLYPVLSALPQEIVYRPLFFRRYATLLPKDPRLSVLLNSGLFSLAHLMYWSPIVALMTFSGGLIFAWSYEVRKNFAEAVVLHSLSGIVVFAMGLGVFFYSGNVARPF